MAKLLNIFVVLSMLASMAHAFTACRPVRGARAMPSKVVSLPAGDAFSAQRVPRSVQRKSMQMGLFGLGTPELVVIGVIAAAVVGPKNLKKLAGDFGKVAGELKDVPEEFQKGLDEGKQNAIEKAAASAKTVDVEEKKEG